MGKEISGIKATEKKSRLVYHQKGQYSPIKIM